MVWMGMMMMMMMSGTHDFSKQVNAEECTISGVLDWVLTDYVFVVDTVLSCCCDLLGSRTRSIIVPMRLCFLFQGFFAFVLPGTFTYIAVASIKMH